MLQHGWIKLHRSMLRWEWYDEPNTKILFLHLLLTVSIETQHWHGILVPRGARIASLQTLAEETGLSIQKIRTALDHLETTGELTRKKQGKATVIALTNFIRYQEDNRESAAGQQAANSPATSHCHQYKKEQEERRMEKERKGDALSRTVIPTLAQVQDYCRERHSPISPERFFHCYEASGWRRAGQPIADWRAVVQLWETTEQNYSRPGTARENAMTQEEIDTMNDYLSLVNRFPEEESR